LDSDGWREYDTNSNDLWDPGTDLDDDEYAGGGIIELYAPAGYEPAIRASEIMADGLEKMGIRAYVWPSEFHVFPPPDIHDFLVNCWTEGVSVVNPPRILYDNFRTGAKYNSPADPDNNWYHFSNSSIDSVLDQMIEASSLEDVKTYAREANRLLAFEQPQIVVYNDININAYRTDMFDGWFEFSGVGIASGGYYENNPYCATKVHLADCSFGETLNYGLSDELRTLNPYLQYTRYEETVYQYIYERLWNIDPFTWDSIPGLAYDWKIEETTANGTIQDGQKFTFYLYENETWHDGKPFTAADVNHSLHMWRKSPRSSPEMANVYKVDLPNGSNGYNIELYVNETACFEWADTTRFYITPEHIWRDVTNVSALIPTDNQIIGTGPYKWNEYVPGESISLLRHEDWRWDIRDVPISPSSSSVEGSSIQMTTTQQSSISENTPGFTLVILSSVLLIKRPKRKRNS
jgi:ABC-type transport system substrate-binding protein